MLLYIALGVILVISSSHYGVFFGSFPIKGEGWDGGKMSDQTLNPLPSPPPDRRRGF